jgi:hypothetical protein
MECTVNWTGGLGTRSGMGFVAETGSGHTLMMDGAADAAKPEFGGQNLAPRPLELLLAGAADHSMAAALEDQHHVISRAATSAGQQKLQRAGRQVLAAELGLGGVGGAVHHQGVAAAGFGDKAHA